MQMSRRFLPFVAVFAAMALPLAAATLSAGSGSTSPGGSLEIALTFKAEGAQATGVNFDLEYDSSALYISAKEGAAAQAAGKGLSSNELSSGKVRYLVTALNQNVIGDGVLVVLSVQVKSNASGSYTLKLTNVAGTDKSAKTIALTGVNGTVTAGSGGNRPRITSVEHGTNSQPGIFPAGGWVAIKGAGFMTGSGRIWDKAAISSEASCPRGWTRSASKSAAAPPMSTYISPGQINVLAPMDETDENGERARHHAAGLERFLLRQKEPLRSRASSCSTRRGQVRKRIARQRRPYRQARPVSRPIRTSPPRGAVSLILYGTGFGQTNPPIVNGEMPVAAPLANPVTITIGGRPAEVLYAGTGGRGAVPVQREECPTFRDWRPRHHRRNRRRAEPRRSLPHRPAVSAFRASVTSFSR